MSQADEIDRLGIGGFLETYRSKELLRLLTCGSVDDGKSTLIGRLLHDSHQVFDDHLAAARKDTARYGTTGEEIDFALLTDGLKAEREQGITIDVAYRYFATDKRKFIIADTPGHEQYTRNMATGASNSDLAVILVDARHGVLDQTRRHAFIATLLGIKHVVVAINKMDLVDFRQDVYESIRAAFADFSAKLNVGDLHFIPMSARAGDNVVFESPRMPWYHGGPLLDYLETVYIASDRNLIDLRLPIQHVLRPNLDFRGFAGTIGSGILRKGDEVVALPSGKRSRIASILTFEGEREEAFAPMAVVVTLEDEVDVSRGDQLVHVNNAPRLENRIEAMIVWMSETPLEVGKSYLLKHNAAQTSATVTGVRYRTNVSTMRREEADKLALNEIGRLSLETMRPLAYDPYQRNRATGSFILIDRLTNATLAAGMIVDRKPADDTLARRSAASDAGTNVRAQRSRITTDERARKLGQRPFTVWLTGLPRAGKSSIAFALEQALIARGLTAHVLDGETLRTGISSDLGFSGQDRWENQRRAAEIARLCNELGLITIAALVSPLAADRAQAERIVGEERFVEVFCNAPLAVCEQRDSEGLYARARAGELDNVTGVDAPYEPPQSADVVLDTAGASVEQNVAVLVEALVQRGLLG
jgi:bifunctional enzyme CysN/CysC